MDESQRQQQMNELQRNNLSSMSNLATGNPQAMHYQQLQEHSQAAEAINPCQPPQSYHHHQPQHTHPVLQEVSPQYIQYQEEVSPGYPTNAMQSPQSYSGQMNGQQQQQGQSQSGYAYQQQQMHRQPGQFNQQSVNMNGQHGQMNQQQQQQQQQQMNQECNSVLLRNPLPPSQVQPLKQIGFVIKDPTSEAKIQQLQHKLNETLQMQQLDPTQENEQKSLDYQEQIRTLKAQQEQQKLRQQQQQQQQQQQTFVIRSAGGGQPRQMNNLVGQQVNPNVNRQVVPGTRCIRGSVRTQGNMAPGQGLRFNVPQQRLRLATPQQQNQPNRMQTPQQVNSVQVVRMQGSQQAQLLRLQTGQQLLVRMPGVHQTVQRVSSPVVRGVSGQAVGGASGQAVQAAQGVQHIIQVSQPVSNGKGVQLVGSQGMQPKVQYVRIPQQQQQQAQGSKNSVPQQGKTMQQQQQAQGSKNSVPQQGKTMQQQQQAQRSNHSLLQHGKIIQHGKTMQLIKVLGQPNNSTTLSSSSISSGQQSFITRTSTGKQELLMATNIPVAVANTEEVETSETGMPATGKPKRKSRPSAKKRTAEQDKADRIVQEAVEKAKSEGRDVPKVVETEDGEVYQVPQGKKKATPKNKKADTEKERKEKQEAKEPKPKATPKPRPPKRKKTIPTFLKNKKRAKKAESDEEEIKMTPPSSPGLDDAFKRRSSRNTKRKKYNDELDLGLSEDDDDDDDLGAPAAKRSKAAAAAQEAELQLSVVEKILASRIGKRPKVKEDAPPPPPPEPLVEPDRTFVSQADENLDVDIMDEEEETPLFDPFATGNFVDPSEVLPGKKKTAAATTSVSPVDEDAAAKKQAKPEADKTPNVSCMTSPSRFHSSPTKKRVDDDVEYEEVEEFYVKFKGYSYLHCKWHTVAELIAAGDSRAGQKVKRFRIKGPSIHFDNVEDEYFNPDYVEVDRILDTTTTEESDGTLTHHYLVKWRGLAYEDATWELETDVDNRAKINDYLRISKLPSEEDTAFVHRPKANEWEPYKETPIYKNDNSLREYQLEGINWLLFCYHNKQNCILADEMGLGKTVQSITYLKGIFDKGIKGPYLVIVPLSTIGNWQKEFELWTDMNVIIYHGTQASRSALQNYEMYYKDEEGKRIPDVYRFNALVTTYEVIIQDIESLSLIDWRSCVIDEAHRLKNTKCKLSEALKHFELEHRVLLSGTPLQNNVEELFALLNFLQPKQFNSLESFMVDFGNLQSESQVNKLKEILKPMMLRRLKEDVEKTLAPKEETIIEVELTNIQKKYYKAILEKNFGFLTKANAGLPSLMNTMMELRKCCNHPFLINGAEEQIFEESGSRLEDGSLDPVKSFNAMVQASGKLVLLDKLLPKLKAGGHKVLIFSQMIKVLNIIEDYLREKQYQFERIDGSIRGNLRQEAIDRFSAKDSQKFCFLLCTRAGGLGINLTAADTVVIYDSDWNPQNDLQAQARCHRIGQKKTVNVYRLITRNSYEREMFDKASLKLGLDKAVLQNINSDKNNGNPSNMSKKDVELLLKKGAYGALMDDQAGEDFCEEDIDQILKRRTQVIQIEGGEKGSTFSKATFAVSGNRTDIELGDPDFWTKWSKEANVAVAEPGIKNCELIMEEPRQRKQTARYTFNDGEGNMTDLESSEDSDSDGGNGKRGGKKGVKGKPGRRRRDEDDEGPIDGPFDTFTRADCFKVEKNLLVYGWGRWEEILKHGKHRRRLAPEDVKRISRTMLFYALQHYAGDERIKGFIYELIVPRKNGEEQDEVDHNHSGLSAPVPRGRKGKKQIRGPGPTEQDTEMARRMDLDPDALMTDENYKKHLRRQSNKVILRTRLLYYLQCKIIGQNAAKIKAEVPASEIEIPQQFVEGDLPTYWWDNECDRSLLIGVFKHGFEKYNLMRNDPCLVFLKRCGPPDANQLAAEQNDDEETKNPGDSDEEGDADFKPRARGRGRPSRKRKASRSQGGETIDEDEEGNGNGTKEAEPVVQAEEGSHPWPTVSDLNTRFRRVVTGFQRCKQYEQSKLDQVAKKNEKRKRTSLITEERERARVESRQRWVRREENEFYRVISSHGVERNHATGEYKWDIFRRLANANVLDKKFDETLTAYFKAFYYMCKKVCKRFVTEEDAIPPNELVLEPITEERANRCLTRIDLLTKIRDEVLLHPELGQRLKLCQRSSDMPDWWKPGEHDKELLIGAAKHGLSRTDNNIGSDDVLLFNNILQQKHQALLAATKGAASGDAKPKEEPLDSSFIKSESSTQNSQDEMKEEVKEESSQGVAAADKEIKSSSDSDEEKSVKKEVSEESTSKMTENGEVSQSAPSTSALQLSNLSMFWPKDRVIQLRLERVCHTIEHGEWPASRKYKLLPDGAYDSRSSTPAPGTPNAMGGGGEYSIMDGSAAATPDGLKLKLKRGSGHRHHSRKHNDNLSMRHSQSILVSDDGSESNLSGFGMENGDDSNSNSNLEPGEFIRKRKMQHYLKASNSPARRRHAANRYVLPTDPDARINVYNGDAGIVLRGDDAPKRKDIERFLLTHKGYRIEGIEESDEDEDEDEDGQGDIMAMSQAALSQAAYLHHQHQARLAAAAAAAAHTPSPGPGRRRTRLDPSKLDLNAITGEENVAVVNRTTGKKITGAKAPPLKHLTQWLERNADFDVDPKWAHIVKSKGNLPEDMHSRIMVSRRHRMSHQSPSVLTASSLPSSAAGSASSTVSRDTLERYKLSTENSTADPAMLALYNQNLKQFAEEGATSQVAGLSAMSAIAAYQQACGQSVLALNLGSHGQAAAASAGSSSSSSKEAGETSSSTSSSKESAKKNDEQKEAAATLAIYQQMMQNPQMMMLAAQQSAQAAQSAQYAQAMAIYKQQLQQKQMMEMLENGGDKLKTPTSKIGKLGVASVTMSAPPPSSSAAASAKKQRVRDNSKASHKSKSRTLSSNMKGMDLTKKSSSATTSKSSTPLSSKPSTPEPNNKSSKKKNSLENIVQDLSHKSEPQTLDDSSEEDSS